jgi:hypothetical protein
MSKSDLNSGRANKNRLCSFCENYQLIRNIFDICDDCKCETVDCKNIKLDNFSLCVDCKCENNECKNEKLDNKKYCEKCICKNCKVNSQITNNLCSVCKCSCSECNNQNMEPYSKCSECSVFDNECKLHTKLETNEYIDDDDYDCNELISFSNNSIKHKKQRCKLKYNNVPNLPYLEEKRICSEHNCISCDEKSDWYISIGIHSCKGCLNRFSLPFKKMCQKLN